VPVAVVFDEADLRRPADPTVGTVLGSRIPLHRGSLSVEPNQCQVEAHPAESTGRLAAAVLPTGPQPLSFASRRAAAVQPPG